MFKTTNYFAEQGGPLLCLFGQLGVELLDVHQSFCEDQCFSRTLQVLHVHFKCCQTGVPQIQPIPHTLSTDTNISYGVMAICLSIGS